MKQAKSNPKAIDKSLLESGQWERFFKRYFPITTFAPFAPRHRKLLQWFEDLQPGIKPRPRVDVWPRGGAKSSTGGLGVVRLGIRQIEEQVESEDEEGNKTTRIQMRPLRRFVLYVSGTQGQANKHVAGIATKFESLDIGRDVGKYGNSKGWKIDLLRTETGFNVLALGLDAAARGIKLDDFRPDLIIFDDIDERHDKPEAVEKKISTITDSILPAGSSDCAILFLQNKIHKDSIVAMLCDGRADFLLTREPAAVEPALRGLKFERYAKEDGTYGYKILEGEPTWEGQNLATCESQMNEWGRSSFLREAQHETDEVEDGLWQRERDITPFRYTRAQLNKLQIIRTAVAIDPSIGGAGDEAGILCGGIAKINGIVHGFLWRDISQNSTPKVWTGEAVNLYHAEKADAFLYEGNFFKQIIKDYLETIDDAPVPTPVFVFKGKLIRAEPIQKLCEEGRIHFVGSLPELESQLCTYKEGDDSPGRMDAFVILMTNLMLRTPAKTQTSQNIQPDWSSF